MGLFSPQELKKYNNAAVNFISSDKIFCFEGLLDKQFYSQFPEINRFTLRNLGNCTAVEEHVDRDNNCYGIIDNDYKYKHTQVKDRIFRIDYYSIESIVICNHSKYEPLCNAFAELITENDLSEIIIRKIEYDVTRKEDKSVDKFNLVIGNKSHDDFHNYLYDTIVDNNSFFKYMNLKEVVTGYMKYLNEKGEKFKNKHILDLHEHLDVRCLSVIFDEREYSRLQCCL